MKKGLIISLFILLVIPFYFSCAFLLYKKQEVKSEVKEHILRGIDRKDLVYFNFSSQAFNEVVASSEEFYYQGNMYDLVEFNKVGDYYECWCWLDCEESELGRKLSLLVAQAMGDDSKKDDDKKALTDWFKLLYYPEAFNWSITPIDSIQKPYPFYLMSKLFFGKPCLLLPPELTC